MKTCVQRTWSTENGVHLVQPDFTEPQKARAKLLSLHMVRELITLEIADCTDERVELHLKNSYDDMTSAIYYAEQGGLAI